MLTTGMTTNTPTTARTVKVRPHRTQAGSCWAWQLLVPAMTWGFSKIASVFMAHAPTSQPVNQQQHGEGNDQQHDRNRRRFTVRELLQARDDQDRGNLRFVRHVPRDEDHRAVLANAAGKGQSKARDQRRIKP